jgi:hypothetical protein
MGQIFIGLVEGAECRVGFAYGEVPDNEFLFPKFSCYAIFAQVALFL